ncbi:hypothetical protein BDQ17DRAFT_171915 [Cyathus striatus]|nr:hypothetical protein BDQ17DRAFT_171915 [Cyathus striatus]
MTFASCVAQNLFLAFRKATFTSKSLLRKLAQWLFYFCLLLRPRGCKLYDEHSKEKPTPKPPLTPSRVAEDTGTSTQHDTQSDTTIALHHKSCTTPRYNLDIISLSDPTITFSEHPCSSHTETPVEDSTPHHQNFNRAFSISDPPIPMQPLNSDTLQVPGPQRSFDDTEFSFSDVVSLTVPNWEALPTPSFLGLPIRHSVVLFTTVD